MITWILARKLDWMRRKQLANDYLATAEYRNLLLSLANGNSSTGRMQLFGLILDDRMIAAKINVVTGATCEGFLTVYDPELETFSPGQLLLKSCLQWCHGQGLSGRRILVVVAALCPGDNPLAQTRDMDRHFNLRSVRCEHKVGSGFAKAMRDWQPHLAAALRRPI